MAWTLEEYEKEFGGTFRPMDATPEAEQGWGSRVGAGFSRAAAQGYGLAQSVGDELGLDTEPLARRRLAATASADAVTEQFNRQKGAPGSMEDVEWTSPRSVGLYLGGLAADTAPQLGAIAGASLINPSLGMGVAYTSALADITENQRDASGGGRTDLLAAAVGAGPYVAAEKAFGGLESMALRRSIPKSGIPALDRIPGVRGGLARTGATVLREGVGGGVGETLQEGVNTAFGRMAVNENEQLFSDAAKDRYGEAFVGGALLEGAAGLPGGHRRSAARKPAPAPSSGEDIVGDKADPGSSLVEPDILQRQDERQRPGGNILDRTGGRLDVNEGLLGGARGGLMLGASEPGILQRQDEQQRPGGNILDRTGGRLDVNAGLLGTREQPAGTVLAPQVEAAVQQAMPKPAFNAEVARAAAMPQTPDQAALAQRGEGIKGRVDVLRKQADEATALGVDPKHLNEYIALKGALQQNLIDEDTFQQSVAALASGNSSMISQVKSAIGEFEKTNAEKQAMPKMETGNQAQAGERLVRWLAEKRGKPPTDLDRERLFTILGLDEEGAPWGDRLTMEDVAEIEARVRNQDKRVTTSAINETLKKYDLDEQALNDLYDQIHGKSHGIESDATVLGGAEGDEDFEVQLEQEHQPRVMDSDQSELAGAIDTQDTRLSAEDLGDTGSMRNVGSAKQNVAVEELKAEQRNRILDEMLKNRAFSNTQRMALAEARVTGNVKALTENEGMFDEAEREAFKTLFEHGETSAAVARRRANVEEVVNRRLGKKSEHEKFVREKQAKLQQAERERAEREAAEKKAQEAEFDAGEQALDEDARTLRMHLMDPNKIRQARLIGPSLADAKVAYALLEAKYAKKEGQELPPWHQLTAREQAAFVRAVDTFNYENQPDEYATQEEVDERYAKASETEDRLAQEFADSAVRRRNEGKARAVKKAVAESPEVKQQAEDLRLAEEKANVDRIAKEAEERRAAESQKRKDNAAKKKADKATKGKPKPKWKPGDAPIVTTLPYMGDPNARTKAAPVEAKPEPVQAQEAVDAAGRVGPEDVQEVQRGGTPASGEEVPQGGARGAADATAAAPHGPGPVRGEDGQAAPAVGAEGDIGDVEHRDVVVEYMNDNSSVESDDFADPVKLTNGKYINAPDAAQMVILALSAQERTDPNAYAKLGIEPDGRADVLNAVNEYLEENGVDSIAGLDDVHRSYVGPKAELAEKNAQREVAERMEAKGENPERIRLVTGWFRNPHDKMWRYEISDKDARLLKPLGDFDKWHSGKPGERVSYALSEVLHHPKLFAAYPSLKNVRVVFENIKNGQYGSFSRAHNEIMLNQAYDGLPTLVHEAQHWIQYKEGFKGGGNAEGAAKMLNPTQLKKVGARVAAVQDKRNQRTKTVLDNLLKIINHPRFEELHAAYTEYQASQNEAREFRNNYKGRDNILDNPDYMLLDSVAHADYVVYANLKDEIVADAKLARMGTAGTIEFDNSLSDAMQGSGRMYAEGQHAMDMDGLQTRIRENEKVRAGDRDAVMQAIKYTNEGEQQYRNIAGEYEARDTQARIDMDEEQRRATPPLSSEKIDPEDVVEPLPDDTEPAQSMTRRNLLLAGLAAAANPTTASAGDLKMGKAKPINAEKYGSRVSAAVERILRGGFPGAKGTLKSGQTAIDGAQRLKAAMEQIAQETAAIYPEMAALARRIAALMPEKGLLLTIDDWSNSDAHGQVSFSPLPHLELFTNENAGLHGLSHGTILHEALHAVLAARYYDLSVGLLRGNDTKLFGMSAPEAAAKMEQFKKLFFEFQDMPLQPGLSGTDAELSVLEAKRSPDEFFVRALTDAHFQKYLAGIPYKGKTMWEAFKDWVKTTFFGGKSGIEPSWLDAALEGSNQLLADAGKDKGDWSRLKAVQTYLNKKGAKAREARHTSLKTVTQAAVDRVPAQVQPTVKTMGRMVSNSTKSLIKGLTFTRDLLALAQPGLPTARIYGELDETRNAAKIAHQHTVDRVVSAYKKLSVAERAGVNNFIKSSTMQGKWGYKPKHFRAADREKVVPDPVLERTFKHQLNAEQRAVVEQVFEHGYNTLQQMKTLVDLNVSDEFDANIGMAKAAGDEKLVAELEAEKADQLKQFRTLLSVGEYHPYAPLKRFGNHVVVGKSRAYADLEERLDADPNDKDARKALREMQSQGAHYFVAMRETKHEAQRLRDEISGQYQFADTMEKDRGYLSQIGGNRGLFGMFHRLRGQAARNGTDLDRKAQIATERMMTDLYLSLLSENSARQSERERKNVAGADEDMMRAFHSKGQADANFLASLATGGAMQDALSQMERDANRNGVVNGTTREQRQEHYKEILERHVMDMDYKQTPFVDGALKTASVMQLLTNPAYHLTNMLQPYVMSAPSMAGRFGFKAYTAVAQAHKELGATMFKNGVDHSTIQEMPADVRRGVQALMDKGLINMSLDSEHGAAWSDSKIGRPIAWLKRVSERIEAVNRVATGVAALRLAKDAGMSEQGQIAYAAKIIFDTHGDYSGFNTPSLMRSPVGRLISQYRKFQIIQISNYVRMARDGFFNAKLNDTEKWIARKALAYNLSTMFALGGVLALPGAQAIGAILRAVIGDDDEPDNPELTMRRYLSAAGLEGISDLLVKGVPAWLGVDVSGRLGAGNILSMFPMADTSDGLVSRKAFESYALAATGPFIGGLMPKLADGVAKISNGDVYKGVENLMPNGVGNILKGARQFTQGVTDSKGNTVMAADQVSTLGALSQAIGLPPTSITERTSRAQALRQMDLFYKGKASEIKSKYVQAYRAGDQAELTEAREEWKALQQRMKSHDMTPPKVSDLVKAPHAQAKKDKSLVAGVATTKRTAGAARQLADIYD